MTASTSGAEQVADNGGPRAAAAEAVRLVQARPLDARALASAALTEARASGDLASASMAERALGLVAKELNDAGTAVAHLRSAVRLGERAGDPLRVAQARMSLSLVLAHRGSTAKALHEADLACAMLSGADGARAQMQRALVLQHLGRGDEALAGYRRALSVFRRSHDRLWEMRLLANRGVLHTYRGEFALAEADLVRAEELSTELGLDLGMGLVRHNLGFLYARRGDVPAALKWYDRADEAYREGGTRPTRLLDRCELLLSVRLVAEARRAAEQAVADFTAGRDALRAAEARLQLSQAALLDDDAATARAAAETARRAFSRQGRRSCRRVGRRRPRRQCPGRPHRRRPRAAEAGGRRAGEGQQGPAPRPGRAAGPGVARRGTAVSRPR
ncbi:MAG: tetratricopeptide repeat protein [Actinobacteria bacterium]|nr:tetratricopeptide repeat protein [Actinomycetota bacterium]